MARKLKKYSPELKQQAVQDYLAGKGSLRQLLAISEKYPDCAMDVTGGSDAELFAAGLFAAKANVRVFTYSRRIGSTISPEQSLQIICHAIFCIL